MIDKTDNNPFIGLRTYEESDSLIFRGRNEASKDLFRLIISNDAVVLHAESGEGKSSLLNAGLIPILREERFFPIKISFTDEDFLLENPDFNLLIYQRIIDSLNQINLKNNFIQKESNKKDSEKLNSFGSLSHDNDIFKDTESYDGKIVFIPPKDKEPKLRGNEELRKNIWWLLRNYRLNVYGADLTPVLIFDQFEEVFSRPPSNNWTEDFFLWLSQTLNDEVPDEVIKYVRKFIGPETEFPKIQINKNFKALFSLRTEYMGEIDYWAIQRHHISVMKNSRYCLKPLTEKEADTVLALQPAFTPEIQDNIKKAISSSQSKNPRSYSLPKIPAMLLSVVSMTVSSNIEAKKLDANSLSEFIKGDKKNDIFTQIISDFYHKEIKESKIPNSILRKIEDALVDDKGKRVRIKADSKDLRNIDFESRYKPVLEQKRLIKCSQVNGEEYVELVHDAIARVIQQDRIKDTAIKHNLGNILLYGAWFLLVACLLVIYGNRIINIETSKKFLSFAGVSISNFNIIVALFNFAVLVILGLLTYKASRNKNKWGKIFFFVLYFFCSFMGLEFMGAVISKIPIDGLWFVRRLWVFVILLPFFISGCYLLFSKNRWKFLSGLLLVYISYIPICWKLNDILLNELILAGLIFLFVPYLFKKDKNFWWIGSFVIVFLLIYYNSYYKFLKDGSPLSIFLSVCIMIGVLCTLIIFSLNWPEQQDFAQTIIYLRKRRIIKDFPVVKKSFRSFCCIVIIFICAGIGKRLSPGSTFLLPIFAVILMYCLPSFIKGAVTKKTFKINALIVFLSVSAIGISQFYVFHTVFIILVWIVSLGLLLFIPKFDNRIVNVKCILSSILCWGLCIVVLPFIVLGYNILALNMTYITTKLPIFDKERDVYLMIVKNRNGETGVRDRAGNIVVPIQFDDIVYYSGNFLLGKNGYYSSWMLDEHLTDKNALTNKEVKDFQQDVFLSSGNKGYDELRNIYRGMRVRGIQSTALQQYAESEILTKLYILAYYNQLKFNFTSKEFDLNDTTELKALSNIPYFKIDTSLLPLTSDSFKEKFMNLVVPNLSAGPYGKLKDILEFQSNDFDDDLISSNESNFNITTSEEADPQDINKFILGDIYGWLADINLDLGNLYKAREYSDVAIKKGKFNEPSKIVNTLTSYLLEPDEVKTQIKNEIFNNQNDLIRINEGLENFPDPELEGAWKFIYYNTYYNLLKERIEDLNGILNSAHYNQLSEMIDSVIKKQEFNGENDEYYSYDFVQKVPDETYDNLLKYIKILPQVILDYPDELYKKTTHQSSFYVNNGKILTPVITQITYPYTYTDSISQPLLFIDYVTKKREFMVDNGSLTGYLFPNILPGTYDHAWPFSDGLAAIEVNNKIGFIDTNGNVVISPQFNSPYKVLGQDNLNGRIFNTYSSKKFKQPYFENGIAPVYDNDNNLVYINKEGQLIGEFP